MKFINDISPADYMLAKEKQLIYLIVFRETDKFEPFIVRVLDTDELGWCCGIKYELSNGQIMSEWPKHWSWASWEPNSVESESFINIEYGF